MDPTSGKTTQASPAAGGDLSMRQRAQGLLATLQGGDEAAVGKDCLELMAKHSLGVSQPETVQEMEERRFVHEAVDRCLRECLLAERATGEFWKTMLLPLSFNVLNHGNLISNGKWLRRSGSEVPDNNHEVLDANVLAVCGLEAQAKLLGRFMVANDGGAVVQYSAMMRVLDPVLLPAWTDWVLSCHNQSPGALASAEVSQNQERTLQDLLRVWKDERLDIAGTPVAMSTAYERGYRTAGSTAPVAQKVLGESLEKLYWNMGPLELSGPATYPEFENLRDSGLLVFCPNWREKHVVHRCMSQLLEPMRKRDGTRVLMLHEAGTTDHGQCAQKWQSQSIELDLRGYGHYLYKIGLAADELKSRNIDLMYFPEMCPRNASAWMGLQRVARVQATGYGFPLTTGSEHMDYFIGGADVEGDGSDYVEQLVLIPGWGQALVEPPLPIRERVRPQVEDRVQLVTVATSQKLNRDLLEAWNEILRGEQNVELEIFPSLKDVEAELLAPQLAPYLSAGPVQLNGWTPRENLLDTLVQSDIYLDTFPYGGYNCLIEALASGLPIVTIEGDRARNRNGAVLLRRLGMPEFLIARDYTGYINAAKQLVRDSGLRRELRERLSNREAVLAALHDSEAPEHFTAALDWMRQQGPRNGRKPGPPVLIRAGDAPRERL
ncbi:MAG: glycosyltransferase involved in cell wall biosynthesis [Candidatus Paceibacteria bacterium]|jgi:glycosyltransferase involved in cell wall biosynthesis